ncbi:MAG: LD-carboxypeptidase [Comamonadaceae bacterium]|nr:LD-carboxypeptidase [Comamonadaceae bacterium]
MAHIYIYSPSSAVRDRAAFRRGIRRLQSQGHEVEVDEAALASHQRFAGDDATRLAAIGRAAASGADVALISRGGYGLTRLLPALPYAELERAIGQGTRFVGFSDFTALQLAVLARTGATTWAGPSLGVDFGTVDAPDDIMQACFDDLLSGAGEGTGWRLPAPRRPRTGQLASEGAGRSHPLPESLHIHQATLWGGNLAMVCALLGTPYWPSIQNGILFLEDVGEHPYRIERMLTQLLHAGVLGQQQAVLLGAFSDYTLSSHDKGFNLHAVVSWLRTQTCTPILTGLPFGHVPTKVLLPVGACTDLLLQGRDALILWGHDHAHADDAGGHDHHDH